MLTNYAGEMIQHDSPHHKFSPHADKKLYLITSLNDYSRFMLYADLVETETTRAHICALEYVFLSYGRPLLYYVDSHSIFRFVQKRDSFWRNHYKLTDDVYPQWKQVLKDSNAKATYTISPPAKGKMERPYRWIHSTTEEVPDIRFQRALRENLSLFRKFSLKPPFKSTKDIFCLRVDRTINNYRRVSLDNIIFKPKNAECNTPVNPRISPITKHAAGIRFWCNNNLIDVQRTKIKGLASVHF